MSIVKQCARSIASTPRWRELVRLWIVQGRGRAFKTSVIKL